MFFLTAVGKINGSHLQAGNEPTLRHTNVLYKKLYLNFRTREVFAIFVIESRTTKLSTHEKLIVH